MTRYFDTLETQSQSERSQSIAQRLPALISTAMSRSSGWAERLSGVDSSLIDSREALSGLPLLRKSDLVEAQKLNPPFGGLTTKPAPEFSYVFQSPGPIYEPGDATSDWWRFARFLHAAGFGPADVVQNCFSYHLTPAGIMLENAARSVGATVLPAGTGQTELQIEAAAALGVTAYCGTPDYLKVLLEKADEMNVTLGIKKAAVSGGALFPSLRQHYQDRGISCVQCYGTADLGLVAYESPALEGMIVDEGVIVEIVRPGTGDPLPEGEVGEVVVTTFNDDYPLIRFATGDLSAVMPGESPCGRTNMRIRGWMGRADQTTKVKGMFVRPEQIAAVLARHPEISKARILVERVDAADTIDLLAEASELDAEALAATTRDILKLRVNVQRVEPGSLPNDGLVIEDRRDYEN